MHMDRILHLGLVSFLMAVNVRGEFVPGHIYVSEVPNTFCADPGEPNDRIWQIDPESGDAILFAQLPDCRHVTGLTFTPDGTRLRASALVTSEILEFDSEGNFTVALDADDGIAGPRGANNIAYDAEGNFYVVNAGTSTLMRFPSDGGRGTVLADWNDGIRSRGNIAFAADGDLYLSPGGDGAAAGDDYVLRFHPPGWEVSLFDSFGLNTTPGSVSADRSGYVYVRDSHDNIFRYVAGDPATREVLTSEIKGGVAFTIAPDHRRLLARVVYSVVRIGSIDVQDGGLEILGELPLGIINTNGIAVVPYPFVPGDFDLDGAVDLTDFARFDECFSGPNALMEPGCGLCDLDRDVDVDMGDLGQFQLAITGR